jgi:hypothetical protein
MKIASGALATLLLTGIGWALPAQAQGVPQGTYLQSCSDVGLQGDSLVATCRRGDGLEVRSVLAAVRRCASDIGNRNGRLQCAYAGGGQGRGQVLAQPAPPPPYGAAPPYGAPLRGYAAERWERCHGLHREAEELQARLAREGNPMERARTEDRLREVRELEERCR